MPLCNRLCLSVSHVHSLASNKEIASWMIVIICRTCIKLWLIELLLHRLNLFFTYTNTLIIHFRKTAVLLWSGTEKSPTWVIHGDLSESSQQPYEWVWDWMALMESQDRAQSCLSTWSWSHERTEPRPLSCTVNSWQNSHKNVQ